MTHSQAENVIKNIIREIGQECAMKGQTVSETLVAFMVKVVVLDPRNGFNVDRTLTKADVQKLIKLCIERLLDTRNPSLDTIKMQVYFDMNYSSRVDLINEQHRILESRLAPVGREITDNRARTREELESVYRKMVSYVLLRSGLGSPTDIKVIREATVPAILNEAIPAATHHIEIELQTSQDLAYRYTAIIETMHQSLNAEMELKLTMLKEVLYNVRQHEAYLCVILSDVITCSQEIDMMQKQLAAQMEQLKDVVRAKTAVPTSQVYPSFITLSNLWTSFQDEILVLSFLNNLTVNLQQFLNAHAVIFPEDVMESLLEGIRVKTDDERLKESADDKVNVSDFTSEEWLFPETTINFSQLIVQYHGFCAYSFAVKDGLLVPGNPSLGILKHKEKYYTFCSRESAYCFARNPDKYIKMIGDKAKESPELIQLLELHHQFESLAPYSQIKSKDKSLKPITKCDSSTQTDTHILPPTIVKDYEWNEWELRRKAIKLANLRQKLTHSVQTNLSHMRRDNSAQVYLMKDSSTQTKRESSSNVPRPQIFLAGLRGGTPPITRMTKVNLTRAVDET
ncbi:cilia- and flagella-associated protein 206 isoform X3 [Sphaerodactylus townsendi]|uniref:cilia- and flagella-associated protein 206 isoform X3 n=1 Tax=Sphaerodactylus townsendi TaxID=933632 RepID=UPI002025EFD7|nr:cilia- and flagella-associated protein 206 isoform X3 [Sphaerodactylus townsendi]